MGSIDTGLGWSADENWLKYNYGFMGTMTQETPLTPIPVIASPQATLEQFRLATLAYSRPGFDYARSSLGAELYVFGVRLTDAFRCVTVSKVQNTTFTVWSHRTTNDNVTISTQSTGSPHSDTGLYYYAVNTTAGTEYTPYCEVFDTLDAGMAAAKNSFDNKENFYKMNTGYAISCFATYLNANSKTVTIPVLISSSSGYTNISQQDPEGGQAVDIAVKSQHLVKDITFTMGIGFECDGVLSSPGAYNYNLMNTQLMNTQPMPGIDTPEFANALFNILKNAASIYVGNTDNPYEQAGTSGSAGGDGDYTFDSQGTVDIPSPPSFGAYATGFISLYNPTASQLGALAHYLWSPSFDLANYKKIFANPMEAFIGLHMVPLTQAQIGGAASEVVVGNISTGLSMNSVPQQFYSYPMGQVTIPRKWGAYLDYAPYTKLQLYLPYIGFQDIAPDDVIGTSVTLTYNIDVLSGTCVAFVYANDHVLYEFGGNCSTQCPITEGQFANALLTELNILSTAGAGLIGVGLGGLMGAAHVPGMVNDTVNSLISTIKPDVKRAGNIGGSAGLMGIQKPYFLMTSPNMCIPGDQNVYLGYPSFMTMQMNLLSGYTEIDVTHLNNMTCTEPESLEIIELLKEGVIF